MILCGQLGRLRSPSVWSRGAGLCLALFAALVLAVTIGAPAGPRPSRAPHPQDHRRRRGAGLSHAALEIQIVRRRRRCGHCGRQLIS
jgi:hypothetical protein